MFTIGMSVIDDTSTIGVVKRIMSNGNIIVEYRRKVVMYHKGNTGMLRRWYEGSCCGCLNLKRVIDNSKWVCEFIGESNPMSINEYPQAMCGTERVDVNV